MRISHASRQTPGTCGTPADSSRISDNLAPKPSGHYRPLPGTLHQKPAHLESPRRQPLPPAQLRDFHSANRPPQHPALLLRPALLPAKKHRPELHRAPIHRPLPIPRRAPHTQTPPPVAARTRCPRRRALARASLRPAPSRAAPPKPCVHRSKSSTSAHPAEIAQRGCPHRPRSTPIADPARPGARCRENRGRTHAPEPPRHPPRRPTRPPVRAPRPPSPPRAAKRPPRRPHQGRW